MGKNRLEAFSVITIMVLELKPPHGAEFRVLLPLCSLYMSYVLSFSYVGIYWNKLQYGGQQSIAPDVYHFVELDGRKCFANSSSDSTIFGSKDETSKPEKDELRSIFQC